MKKWIWLLILNFFIAAPAFAAGTLTAKLNRNPVPVGETFVLSLEYEGDPGSEKPDFSPLNRDFTVYMVSNSYKGIYTNGKMKKLYIWNVTMAADRTGAFTIPPLSVGKASAACSRRQKRHAASLRPSGHRDARDGVCGRARKHEPPRLC